MTVKTAIMPEDTASLIRMCLDLLRVTAFDVDKSTIGFWAEFETGRCLFTVKSVTRKRLLSSTPLLCVTASADSLDVIPNEVFLDSYMSVPRHKHDVVFMAKLAVEIKSTAWAVAGTEDMGECVSFPGRPTL